MARRLQRPDRGREFRSSSRAHDSAKTRRTFTQKTMTQDLPPTNEPVEMAGSLPFPFKQQNFCRYEPIEQRIEEARVLVIDNLLRDERDLSPVAQQDWGTLLAAQLRRERHIAGMAIENILDNISRLVKQPTTEIAHVSEIAEAVERLDRKSTRLNSSH